MVYKKMISGIITGMDIDDNKKSLLLLSDDGVEYDLSWSCLSSCSNLVFLTSIPQK